MTALSSLVFSLFAYVSLLWPLNWKNQWWRKTSWKWVKFIEKTCFIHTFSLFLVGYLMFPYENSVCLRFFKTCSLKHFISSNSDNCVQTVIIIGNTYVLWQNHVLNVFLRWIWHYKHCFAMKTLSSLVFSLFAYLGLSRRLKWKKPMLKETFMEVSEIHWDNMFYPCICTDSSSSVNVYPW